MFFFLALACPFWSYLVFNDISLASVWHQNNIMVTRTVDWQETMIPSIYGEKNPISAT